LTDHDGDPSTANLTINFPTVVAPTVAIGANDCLSEDTQGPISFTATPQSANSHITEIVVGGLTGWNVDTGSATASNGTVTATFVAGVLTFTLSGASANTVETVTINMTPPLNTDVDTSVSMTATAAAGVVSVTGSSTPGTVYVDAVADAPTNVDIIVTDSNDAGSGFSNSESGTLRVLATFGDVHDSSEVHTLSIHLQSGFTAGLAANGTISGTYNTVNASFSYTYNSATGDIAVTVPPDSGLNPNIGQTADIDLSFSITAPSSGTLPDTLTFDVTATANENPVTDGGCDVNNGDIAADNIATATDTTGIPATRLLFGNIITNTNVQPQTMILTFVDQDHPVDAFAQMFVRAGQGQQGAVTSDAGFNITGTDHFQVSLEATLTTTTNINITQFDLNGVTMTQNGNPTINASLSGSSHEAVIAVIQPTGGANPVTLINSTDGTSGANTQTDNSATFNYLYGFGGNDTQNASGATATTILNGGTGADSVTGGSGNDVIVYDSADTLLNGNGGFDILRIDNGAIYNTSIQFPGASNGGFANNIVDLNGHNIQNIEEILLTEEATADASIGTELQGLTVGNVVAFTSATNTVSGTAHSIFIVGAPGDDVQLQTGLAGWSSTANTFTSPGGQVFHQWVATAGGAATASLFIDNDLQVNHAAQP
jgi:hypothetical protein